MDLNHIPLAPPTPPQISNFDDPVTLAHAIQAVSVVCLSLMIPFALIRIYSKAWIVKSFGWEDGQSTLICVKIMLTNFSELHDCHSGSIVYFLLRSQNSQV